METLFSSLEYDALGSVAPLAVRMRPATLEELVGQLEVVGEGTWLRNAIEADSLSPLILYGPAGTGKTTLARIVARATQAHFTEVSAISGGVGDLRRVIHEASQRLTLQNLRTILFVDEIHRFSRSQQDALLHAVEDRVVILIGATTENPFFEVNSALISRSRVIEFKELSRADIERVIERALVDERGLAGAYRLSDAALAAIAVMSGGDARMALTTLELAAEVARVPEALTSEERLEFEGGDAGGADAGDEEAEAGDAGGADADAGDDAGGADAGNGDKTGDAPALPAITTRAVLEASPRRMLPYDRKGDVHYDVISAFIKSMRGSDPDAAVYWLARMIEGGEDPKFIARRILIFASEDVGNADPQALLVAQAAFKAAESIGYPECQLNLSQAALYMALAPKSNSATNAIYRALGEVKSGPLRTVPNHLRDRHRPGAEAYAPYRYPHTDARGWLTQQYLPDGLEKGAFFTPGERGWESYRSEAVERDREEEGRGEE
ncbi:MAG: replication-associated recombination protein A [Coriobacteriales bacterium]|nr:replication-associated recombination protein A [Coriobacteriales bacterium]